MPATRNLTVTTPLGDDVLLLRSMTAQEELGRLFRFDLDLLSEEASIKMEDILGQSCTVHVELPDGKVRHFNGIVSRFSQVGTTGRYTAYEATLRPWLWFLTRTADCRIFQEMTTPDIIKEVFRDADLTDFDESLSGSYRTWEYCVQYRETAFNFVSRLMEQDGIYYYFKHEDGQHTLVLSDSYSSHEPIEGDPVPYFPPASAPHDDRDHVFDWNLSKEVQPGAFVHDDFDFEKPKAELEVNSTIPREHELAKGEIYDYPGEYVESGDGSDYAKRRIEELHVGYEQVEGEGNARGMTVGGLFNFEGYPREDQNREYLIIAATYEMRADEYESTDLPAAEAQFTCSFRAIDAKQQFRSGRVTPKPVVQGPQTAVVVGPSGEEIWTDKYGRVKVQFHWDRYGKADENSSCWMRVAQVWAGKQWGAMHIPRITQEVIVEFLEGDPDRPIVTGRVYNGDSMPPYELPANKTQSGIKSRSSKGGSADNFNEIRMEDKKGEEELYLHAEKNETHVVENDRSDSVGHDETVSIGNDRTEDVGNDETITIGNNRTETVGNNETITIGTDRTESVGSNETVSIGLTRTHAIGVNDACTVGAAQEITVGAARTLTVGAAQQTTVGANHSETIGADHSESIGKSHTQEVGENQSVTVGKKIVIDAGDEILIKTGSAQILMKKDGTINIKGKDITVEGSGAINVKASKNIVMKGTKILQN